jgi:CxxC motif-containing protein (DUF1111 family)
MRSLLTRRATLFLLAGAGWGFLGIYLRAQSPAVDRRVGKELPGGGPTRRLESFAIDPGVRGGPPGAGGPIQGLTSAQSGLFTFVASQFSDIHSISGGIQGEPGRGLGPGYNGNSCSACHNFPASGGTSPPVNPQIAMATVDGAQNSIPSFLTLAGPILEVHFVLNPDGTPDGGVHNLFTIQGRPDAPGCQLGQPDFQTAVAQNNVSFRIPSPTYGDGLIENISDEAILANESANASSKTAMGVTGHENRNPNDGTITRFGWKAQNKSMLIFSGEAYNVEMGVTNELFPTERNMVTGCNFNNLPEDRTDFDTNSSAGGVTSVTQNFATFMRFLAPPAPAPDTASTINGRIFFVQSGCSLCHTPSFTTSGSDLPGLSLQSANLFSDLLVHHMGVGLADGIQQGSAGPDEFRTAPLWGLGQRIFFLHDGRTTDLMQAIEAHQSKGSEANQAVNFFNSLITQQQQDLLNFLRSL